MPKKKLILYLFFLLTVALPLSKAVASLALIGLVGLSILPPYTLNLQCVKKTKAIWLLTTVFFSLLFSITYTQNLANGWATLYQYNAFVLVPLVILFNKKLVQKHSNNLLLAFISATVINCICTLIFYALPSETITAITSQIGFLKPYTAKGKDLFFGLYSPFIERIQLGNLIAIACLSAIYLVMKRKWLFLNVINIVILVCSALLVGGRAGQLGLFVAILAIFSIRIVKYIYPKLKVKIGNFAASILLITAFTALLATPYLLHQNFPPIQKRYGQMQWELDEYYNGVDRDYSHCTTVRRIVSWENSWKVIEQAPILGVGVGDYRNAMQTQYNKAPIKLSVNLHNQFLFFWATSGLLGLGLFVLVIVNWLFYLNQLNNLKFIFGVGFVLCYCLVFCTDAVLNFQVDNMLFSLFFALIPCLNPD